MYVCGKRERERKREKDIVYKGGEGGGERDDTVNTGLFVQGKKTKKRKECSKLHSAPRLWFHNRGQASKEREYKEHQKVNKEEDREERKR